MIAFRSARTSLHLTLPAYKLPDKDILLLDGAHRAVALAITSVLLVTTLAGMVGVSFVVALGWGIIRLCIGERPQYSKHSEKHREAAGSSEAEGANRPRSSFGAWWEVLGVSPQSSLEEVTRCYRRALRMYHPDRLAGLAPELVALAERRTKELNAAFLQAKRLHSRAAQ